jgi:hypothetical protein
MAGFAVLGFTLGVLLVKGIGLLAVVYLGTRLAIRHERARA